jgi:hypothetical protein
MKWLGHLAQMEDRRNVYRVVVGKHEKRSYLEDLDIDG